MGLSERKAALREAVLNAAEAIVASHGLGALKARDVAQKAGCSLGAIYTVFTDLDMLILAINARTLHRLEQELAAHPEPDTATLNVVTGNLVALSGVYLDFAAANRLLWRALFEHRLAEGRALPQDQNERRNTLFNFIERPLTKLGIEPDPDARALLARSLFSALHGMILLGLEEKLVKMPIETLKNQIGIVVIAMLRGLAAR